MGQPTTTPLGLPYPTHSSLPNVHDLDNYHNRGDKGVTIMSATAMDLKWFTYTKTAPSEVEGLGIVSHPHPLRSHPCDNVISYAEYCMKSAVDERKRIEPSARPDNHHRQNSWPVNTAHLVPAPLAPFGGVKRTDSELHRRHQQNLADLNEELESPLFNDDDDESDGSVYDSDRAESAAQAGSVMRNDKEESESDNEGEQDEPVMILGTVRRHTRRPSSIMRLQQEQALSQQYQRSWSPVSTPPRSRANTIERKPSLVRMGTFGPTPPDSPRNSSEPEAQIPASPPPRFSTIVPSIPPRQSTILENKRRLARTATALSSGSASPRQPQGDAPPAYNPKSILEQATLELQREREQQQQSQSTGARPKPPTPSRQDSRSMAYAHFFVMPPDYYSGSASSTPDRVASPSPNISRVTTSSSVTSMNTSAKPPNVPYFPPPPVFASPPPAISPSATAGLYGPPSVVSPSGPDGAPLAMHKIDSKKFSSSSPPSSFPSFSRKFGRRPISVSTNKLKKSKIGENVSKWTTNKVGEPINSIANKLGSEAFWPMTLDKECDKAARILRAFFSEDEVTSVFGFTGESHGKDTTSSPVRERRGSHSSPVQIPPHVMASARGLAIFTTFRAGGLHLSGARGSGVVISRLPSTHLDVGKKWSPPSAFAVQSLGPGLRSGGGAGSEFNDCILVLTTDAALDAFTRPKLGLGSEIGVTAGPILNEGDVNNLNKTRGSDGHGLHSRTKSNDIRICAEEPILSYTRSTRGAWTGAKASGTIVAVRSDANASFYGSAEPLSVESILHGRVPVLPRAHGQIAADGTVMWPEGGAALTRALQNIGGKM